MNPLLETMPPDELRAIKRQLGAKTHREMGELIGVSHSSVYGWSRGNAIPRPMAMLLRLLAKEGA